MLDQVFEVSRKAIESTLQMQQAMFRHWTQDLPSMTPATAGLSTDWGGAMRKRWASLVLEALNKHREWLDSNYRALIQTLEKALRVPDVRSSGEAARAVEDVWKSVFETMKTQSETQFREFQAWIEKALEVGRNADGAS